MPEFYLARLDRTHKDCRYAAAPIAARFSRGQVCGTRPISLLMEMISQMATPIGADLLRGTALVLESITDADQVP